MVSEQQVESKEYAHPREGRVDLKILLSGEVPGGINFTLARTDYGVGEEAFVSPRHRHTFEQVRYAIDGSLNYARGKEIPPGWVAYFPEGAFYGPQSVSGGSVLLLQFGRGYLTEEQKRRAQVELAEIGGFNDGMFSRQDPSTGKRINTDGVQAIWEHVHGTPMQYPNPRYQEPILMNPDAFDWRPTGVAGITTKRLGCFTERELTLDLVRWEQPAALELDATRSQLLYAIEGDLAVDEADAESTVVLLSEEGEPTRLRGESALALIVVMPRGGSLE